MRQAFRIAIVILLCATKVNAQEPCGTIDHFSHLQESDPAALIRLDESNQRINEWVRNHGEGYRAGGVTTIPVVVHIVYKTPTQNIPDSRVHEQIDVLNQDFRRLNADTVNTPVPFKSIMADSQIEFCLAQRDPAGNPTTGILRKPTTNMSFYLFDDVKYDSSGGSDAWPRDQYLNIWVCNMVGGWYGYAQFPGQAAATDGIIVDYLSFGVSNTLAPKDKGRIATHEVGHWLGLHHLWGDMALTCSGTDFVADTPPQYDHNFGCPLFPLTDNCTQSAPGIMFMNYMDYSDDDCVNGFTQGQAARMQAVLATARLPITTSMGCVLPVLPPNDVLVQEITSPSDTSCATSITPNFNIFNWGEDTLTNLDLNWRVDNGQLLTQAWTGLLPSGESTTITLPSQNIAVGDHSLMIYTSDPNGVSDNNPGNDTTRVNFTIESPAIGLPVPYIEDFEVQSFPPAGITINNPDGDYTWGQYLYSATGNNIFSAVMPLFNYDQPGERDELILPAIDLSTGVFPHLTFDLSYRRISVFGYADTLLVQVSIDCGASWATMYAKSGPALATVQPNFSAQPWTPTQNSDWRNELIELLWFSGQENVLIKFVTINGFENNLFIDNIHVLGSVGVEGQLPQDAVALSPNPGLGEFYLDFNLETNGDVEIQIANGLGQEVVKTIHENVSQGRIKLDLKDQAEGIYFVNIRTLQGITTRKLILQRQ